MNDPRMDQNELAAELHSRGCQVKGKTASCPWHEDNTPSASLLQGGDGIWRIYCHRCDRRAHVLDLRAEAAGIPVADLLRKIEDKPAARPVLTAPAAKPPLMLPDKAAVKAYCERTGKVEAWHVYGPKDTPAIIVARIRQGDGKKTFRQFTPMAEGYAAANTLPEGTIPLFRQDEITDAQTVLVVEGEKACNAAWSIGIPCVTAIMGAGKAHLSDWSALAGKEVVLWPDHDEAGAKHMTEVASILSGIGVASLQRIDPETVGLPAKGDIADLVQAWGPDAPSHAQEIRTLMAEADHIGGAAPLLAWHRKVMDGSWRNLSWPLESVGKLSRATMPGTLTLLCADPGAGKSWLLLICLRFWESLGHRCAVRMFEDDAAAHLRRLLSNLTGEGGHTSDAWVRENAELVRAHVAQHRAELDKLAGRIVPETPELWTHDDLRAWVEARARAGCRVIMVDPITGLKVPREPWVADFTLAMQLKHIAYTYECSIIVATHPRGGTKDPSMSAMAGGVAWSRFAHTVLWLTKYDYPEQAEVIDGAPTMVNRTMRILKSRHGKGAGMTVGLFWQESCQFEEQGILDTRKPAKRGGKQPKQDDQRPSRAARVKASPTPDEDLFHASSEGAR